jgi:hypothetical protein
MIQASFSISTKKGESQPTRWLIVQDHPHPDLEMVCVKPRWRNAEGLFPSYNRPATGIGKRFTCYLLSTTAPESLGADYNRTHFAGFVIDLRKDPTPNPGAIVLRGKSLGETQIRLTIERGSFRDPDIRVNNGCAYPSRAEREVLAPLIIPPLQAAIMDNLDFLQAAAVTATRARMHKELETLQASIRDLASQIDQSVF